MNILFGNELYYLVDFLEKKLNDSVDIHSYKSGVASMSDVTEFMYPNDIFELCINGYRIITWIRDNNCRYYGLDIELLFTFINNKFKTELTEFDLFIFEFMYDEVKEFYKREIYETSI